MMPRLDSVCPIRAVSFSSRRWQAMAISQPPPMAWPLMAATIGLGKRSILRITLLPNRTNAAAEDAIAAPGDHQRPHAVVLPQLVQREVQLVDQRLADRVGRWPVERDDG